MNQPVCTFAVAPYSITSVILIHKPHANTEQESGPINETSLNSDFLLYGELGGFLFRLLVHESIHLRYGVQNKRLLSCEWPENTIDKSQKVNDTHFLNLHKIININLFFFSMLP